MSCYKNVPNVKPLISLLKDSLIKKDNQNKKDINTLVKKQSINLNANQNNNDPTNPFNKKSHGKANFEIMNIGQKIAFFESSSQTRKPQKSIKMNFGLLKRKINFKKFSQHFKDTKYRNNKVFQEFILSQISKLNGKKNFSIKIREANNFYYKNRKFFNFLKIQKICNIKIRKQKIYIINFDGKDPQNFDFGDSSENENEDDNNPYPINTPDFILNRDKKELDYKIFLEERESTANPDDDNIQDNIRDMMDFIDSCNSNLQCLSQKEDNVSNFSTKQNSSKQNLSDINQNKKNIKQTNTNKVMKSNNKKENKFVVLYKSNNSNNKTSFPKKYDNETPSYQKKYLNKNKIMRNKIKAKSGKIQPKIKNVQNVKVTLFLYDFYAKIDIKIHKLFFHSKNEQFISLLSKLKIKIKDITKKEKLNIDNDNKSESVNNNTNYRYSINTLNKNIPKLKSFLILFKILNLPNDLFYDNVENGFIEDIKLEDVNTDKIFISDFSFDNIKIFFKYLSERLCLKSDANNLSKMSLCFNN